VLTFGQIAGHRRLLSLVSRALAHDRLPPALLLAGPAGVGKRRVGLTIGSAVNCVKPVATADFEREACGTCATCQRIGRLLHPDVLVVEPGDSGSIKIEQVRGVVDQAGYRPFEGRRRVVVIDEADALVPAAQHALLKTLEEPPSASLFVLVSSMPDALLATVRSRCPRLRFGALSAAEVAEVLMRDHGYVEGDARASAADAEGSVGRALSADSADVTTAREDARNLLEQTARVADPSRRIEMAKRLVTGKGGPAADRRQLAACCRALLSLLRDLGVMAVRQGREELANVDLADSLRTVSANFDRDRSLAAFAAVDRALGALERNASPKVVADWLVLQL
jgi:DNA polymerase-3 subunit delta'